MEIRPKQEDHRQKLGAKDLDRFQSADMETVVEEAYPEEYEYEYEFEDEDEMKTQIIADAFGEVKIFVEAGRNDAFVQLKKPQLHRFQLPDQEHQAASPAELDGIERAEAHEIDKWGKNEVLEVDLVKAKDLEQFGKLQRDVKTGEKYILLPVDIEFLIDPDNMTPESATEYLSSYDRYKEVLLSRSEDKSMDVHTIHIQNLEGDKPKVVHEHEHEHEQGSNKELDRKELDRKELDKKELNKQELQKEELLDNRPKVTPSEETLRESEDQLNWEYHMHEFQVPKFSFPFELKIGTSLDRMLAGEEPLCREDLDLETTEAEAVEDTDDDDDLDVTMTLREFEFLDNEEAFY